MSPLVAVQCVTKNYGRGSTAVKALDSVSFEARSADAGRVCPRPRNDTAKPHRALASSPRDLLFAITDRPKHLIALRRWGTAEEGFAKKRVHVFPDDFSFFGNFEEAAERGLSDQCVAVRQALSVAHARREEIPSRLVLVLPYNLVCGWIDLDHPPNTAPSHRDGEAHYRILGHCRSPAALAHADRRP